MKSKYESELSSWIKQERLAADIISQISCLWYEHSIKCKMFRKNLVDLGQRDIIDRHLRSKDVIGNQIPLENTLAMTKKILSMKLQPSSLDLGKLNAEWFEEGKTFPSVEAFTEEKLKDFIQTDETTICAPVDVVLYGFGRIGRLCARELLAQSGNGCQLRLRAIVTRSNSEKDIKKRADLLRTDSVHGSFPGTVIEDLENKALILNGHTVQMIAASNPAEIDYTKYGIDNCMVIDNTGVWRDREGLGTHLDAKGVNQVLLTAPGKGDIPNIVYGVNQEKFNFTKDKIISAASCTTNAISPVLYVMENTFGIEKGHIETIHSYTNDQNLLDNYHKKYRRGRAAPLNMVITETGAAKAVVKAVPSLEGKLTANAVRVPTPNASLAIMKLTLKKHTSADELNDVVKDAAFNGELVEQIKYSTYNELVSSDIIGTPFASVYDAPATIVSRDGHDCVLYVWYDNEYGYTRQLLRLAKDAAGVLLRKYI
jgi:glyceraldehyde 3-phosphate dehydrogenase